MFSQRPRKVNYFSVSGTVKYVVQDIYFHTTVSRTGLYRVVRAYEIVLSKPTRFFASRQDIEETVDGRGSVCSQTIAINCVAGIIGMNRHHHIL